MNHVELLFILNVNTCSKFNFPRVDHTAETNHDIMRELLEISLT